MAETGLGAFMVVDGSLLSNDIGSVSTISTPRPQQVVTGLDKSATERLHLSTTGLMTFEPFFNPAAGAAHPILSTLPTTDRSVTYGHRDLQGAPAASILGKQISYDGSRAQSGELLFATPMTGNGFSLEWGRVLTTGVVTSAGAEDLAGLDYGVTIGTTNFGVRAHLHVIAFTGTSADIVIQDSDDDAAGDPYAALTGAAFTTVTAAGSERIQSARTEATKRWLRISVTGTYSNLQFVVNVVKDEALIEL